MFGSGLQDKEGAQRNWGQPTVSQALAYRDKGTVGEWHSVWGLRLSWGWSTWLLSLTLWWGTCQSSWEPLFGSIRAWWTLAKQHQANEHPSLAGPSINFYIHQVILKAFCVLLLPLLPSPPQRLEWFFKNEIKLLLPHLSNGFPLCRIQPKVILDLALSCLSNSIRHTGHLWIFS